MRVRGDMVVCCVQVVEGKWLIRTAVGHTPVIMGKKLKQTYHMNQGYFEIDIDVASSRAASTVIGIVRGATRSLTVDLAVLIQGFSLFLSQMCDVTWRRRTGDSEEELPESLIGTVRLDHVDMETAVALEQISIGN